MFLNANAIDATIKEYCSSNNIKFSKMEHHELRKTFSKQRKPVPAKFSGRTVVTIHDVSYRITTIVHGLGIRDNHIHFK